MIKDKSRLSIVISAVCTLMLLGLAPASAGATELVPPTDGPITSTPINGGGTLSDPKPPTGSTTTSPSPEPVVTEQDTETDVHNYQEQGNTYLTQLRDKMKTEHAQNQAQTVANRQKRCMELQSMVNKQIASFSSSAQTHLTTFNNVYAKVQAYATANNSSANVQSLITAANTQQANATQAVDALKSVAITVDCTAQDPASSLATIKTAVESTRSALQAYQQAIKAVISSLESAASTQTTTNTTQQ